MFYEPILDLFELRHYFDDRPDPVPTRYEKGYREYLCGDGESTQWVPSVTSVLDYYPKPGLEIWKQRTPEAEQQAILKETGRIGDLVHYAVLDYFVKLDTTNRLVQKPPAFLLECTDEELAHYQTFLPNTWKMFTEFLWWYGKKIKVVEVERFCWNKELGYAGRFDFLFKLYSEKEQRWIMCLGDIKSGKRLPESTGAQLWAYNSAINLLAEQLWAFHIHPYADDFHGWDFIRLEPDSVGFLNSHAEFKKNGHKDTDKNP